MCLPSQLQALTDALQTEEKEKKPCYIIQADTLTTDFFRLHFQFGMKFPFIL